MVEVSGQEFRQGTIGTLRVAFFTRDGILVPQPVGFPIVEVIYIHRDTMQPATAVAPTVMAELDERQGYYTYDWHIPIDHPVQEHQITFWGYIEEDKVIGEDTVTVLPAIPECPIEPVQLTTVCDTWRTRCQK